MQVIERRTGIYEDRAVYSDDMRYRYEFHRTWAPGEKAVWILLNPATGDTDGKPRETLCLVLTRKGEPRHPLYVATSTGPLILHGLTQKCRDHPAPRSTPPSSSSFQELS